VRPVSLGAPPFPIGTASPEIRWVVQAVSELQKASHDRGELLAKQVSSYILTLLDDADPTSALATLGTFATRTAAGETSPPVAPDFITTAGYSATGDGGDWPVAVKSETEPTVGTGFKVQSPNGFWYWPKLERVSPQQGGGKTAAHAQAAADYATANRAVLDFRGEEYVWTAGGVVIPAACVIESKRAEIDISGAASNATAITFQGSEGTRYALTADAAKGALTATMSAANLIASGIVAGSWVRMTSTAVFDPGRTNSRIGEQIIVASVNTSTGVVTFETPLVDTYLVADSATISLLNHLVRPRIDGNLHIRGNGTAGNQTGVVMRQCDRPLIEDLSGRHLANRLLSLVDCQSPEVHALFPTDVRSDTGYGVSVAGVTQDAIITQVIGEHVRHLFSTNNPTAQPGIPRRIQFSNFHSKRSARSLGDAGGDAIDTHAAAEDIHIWDGQIDNPSGMGVNTEGRSGSVKRVRVKNAGAAGFSIVNWTNREADWELEDLICETSGLNGTAVSEGLRVSTQAGFAGFSRLTAKNITSMDAAGRAISILATEAEPIQHAELENLSGWRSANTTSTIDLFNILGGHLKGSYAYDGPAAAAGTRARNIKNFDFDGIGGRLGSSATGAMLILTTSGTGATDSVSIDSVRGESPSASSSTGISIGNPATNVAVGRKNRLGAFTTDISWGSGTGQRGGQRVRTYTYDPANVAAGASAASDFTFPSLIVGRHRAIASFSIASTSIVWRAEVTGTSTVRVWHTNLGGSAVDLAEGTLTIEVVRLR
jgi:hypothetical protein